jgi:hypothetical protein
MSICLVSSNLDGLTALGSSAGSRAQVRGLSDKSPGSSCRLTGWIDLAQDERSLGLGHLLKSKERASIDSFVWPASILAAVGT